MCSHRKPSQEQSNEGNETVGENSVGGTGTVKEGLDLRRTINIRTCTSIIESKDIRKNQEGVLIGVRRWTAGPVNRPYLITIFDGTVRQNLSKSVTRVVLTRAMPPSGLKPFTATILGIWVTTVAVGTVLRNSRSAITLVTTRRWST